MSWRTPTICVPDVQLTDDTARGARTLKRTAGANRWSWNMKVGEVPCVDELTMTTADLSGYRDVTRDYLAIWTDLATQLQAIRNQDIPAFNEVLRRAGLPELYVPRTIS